MVLTSDRELTFYASPELIELPVDDNVVLYKGALVGLNAATGYVRPLVAGDTFAGVAYEQADNTVSGHTAGGIRVRLHQNIDIVHALAGVAAGDVGRAVYATADDTLTLSPLGATYVGRVVVVEGTNLARVRCAPTTSQGGDRWPAGIVWLPDADATLTLAHLNGTVTISNTTPRTLTLPPAADARAGAWLRVIKLSSNGSAVTLDGHSSETIEGATSFAGLDARYDAVLLLCTGTEWIILSRDPA